MEWVLFQTMCVHFKSHLVEFVLDREILFYHLEESHPPHGG